MSQTTIKPQKTKPLSIRLTQAERSALEAEAGDVPLSRYMRQKLLGECQMRRRTRKTPVADKKLLAETLACLGASRIADNLKRLADAAALGNLAFDPDAAVLICRASDDIHAMRIMLMQALGMKIRIEPAVDESLSQRFARATSNRRAHR